MFVRIWIIGWFIFNQAAAAEVQKFHYDNENTVFEIADNEDKWSSWSEWTPCTRSCGGGITSQIRTCMSEPKYSNSKKGKHRKGLFENKCSGNSKRSCICNTEKCPADSKDFRSIQCEHFNDKTFAGSFYNWIPYFNSKNQCALNCRPVGYKFYATLNATVIDGTSCKLANAGESVCVDGQCQLVGCNGLINGDTYDVCGICGGDNSTCRLISGLFTRPHLILGYNYITDIPSQACNISISEIRKTNNLIALRYKNGTYILNSDWVQSKSGTYGAVGTEFNYNRGYGNVGDVITAPGPTTQPLEILLLYKQVNTGIKYEYRVSLQPVKKNENSYQNFPDKYEYLSEPTEIKYEDRFRKNAFTTTPAVSNTELQDIVRDEEYKPKSKNKRKKFFWKITGYTACSKPCGGGTQLPIYSCAKESNSQYTVAEKRCSGIDKPDTPPIRCNIAPCAAQWVASDWSSCSVSCGEGVETREVVCKQEISSTLTIAVADEACLTTPPPNLLRTRPCSRKQCSDSQSLITKSYWQAGSWGSCSVRCGIGIKTRSVQCIGGNEEDCLASNRPAAEVICDMGSCGNTDSYAWFTTDWSKECSESCGTGIQTRRVFCSAGSQLDSLCDNTTKPETTKSCNKKDECDGRWFSGPWSQCSEECGWGKQTRRMVCVAANLEHENYTVISETSCKENDKPSEEQACFLKSCSSQWFSASWSTCTRSCDTGIQRREVRCLNEALEPSTDCKEDDKPATRKSCNTQKCSIYPENDYTVQDSAPGTRSNNSKNIVNNSKVSVSSDADCIDKYNNCHFVAQARLCSYKYYQSNCCLSCHNLYHPTSNSTPALGNNNSNIVN